MRVVSPSVTEWRYGNNEDNCEGNMREDGSQPRADFRRASWRGNLFVLFSQLFMLFSLSNSDTTI
jgi:hypothetical protein